MVFYRAHSQWIFLRVGNALPDQARSHKVKSAFTHLAAIILGTALLAANLGCTQPITKREQSGLIGGSIGAVTGAIVGSAVGHAGAGALIGGPIGLLAGALIGDQLMAEDRRLDYQQTQISRNQAEIDRLRREVDLLRWENAHLREL